jgi:PKHD-type hydroxylase
MFLIQNLLDSDDLSLFRQKLSEVRFVDGRSTAGESAKPFKSNQQAYMGDPVAQALTTFIRQKLTTHSLFMANVRPAKWSKLMISRYGLGDHYGLHTDDAIMTDEAGHLMRTDLSFTLFLSDSQSYDGGALCLDGADGVREIRLEAGDMVIYRTGSIHEVRPVTRGERLACVGWLQSQIRSQDQRDILFDLWQIKTRLKEPLQSRQMDNIMGNLLRLWAET